jgi:hypothetical protein
MLLYHDIVQCFLSIFFLFMTALKSCMNKNIVTFFYEYLFKVGIDFEMDHN